MASPIDDETSAQLDWAPRGETVINDPDVPRSIPTVATDHAPRGRIIDDSARGTIFWEADLEDVLEELRDDEVTKAETAAAATTEEDQDEAKIAGEAQAFGKPFKVEWLTTNRLPFYRTRGLRNPWNANREVKIARDGTELETSVGRRLVQMFHRSQTDPMPQSPMDYGPTRPRLVGIATFGHRYQEEETVITFEFPFETAGQDLFKTYLFILFQEDATWTSKWPKQRMTRRA